MSSLWPNSVEQYVHELQHSKEIDHMLHQERDDVAPAVQVLLQGLKGAGKSTVLNQLLRLHGSGLSVDREWIAPMIQNCARDQLVATISKLKTHVDRDQEEISGLLSKIDDGCSSEEIATELARVWHIPAVQNAVVNLEHLDSTEHFLQRYGQIMDKIYIPTDEDILACHMPTAGAKELKLSIDDTQIKFVEVGGQTRSSRKWLHLFDSVDLVIFVISIDEFEPTDEDETKTKLQESFRQFCVAAESDHLARASFLVLFNKMDIFEEKIKLFALADSFPDYTGGNDTQRALSFLQDKFLQQRPNTEIVVLTATVPQNASLVAAAIHRAVRHARQ